MACMHRSRDLLAAVLACAAVNTPAAQEPSAALRDSAAVVASDQFVDAAAAYCDRSAPAEGAQLRTAHTQWRKQHDVNAVGERLAAARSKAVTPLAPDAARRLEERLQAQGDPAKVCKQTMAALRQPEMDLRQRYPAAYDASALATPRAAATPSPATSTTAAAPSAPSAPSAPAAPARAAAMAAAPEGALVINPAQLQVMKSRAKLGQGGSRKQWLQEAGLAGALVIKGRVVKKGDSFFIDHVDGVFQSAMSVSPGISLKAYEGQEVAVAGQLDEWPSSLAFLRNSRLVDGRQLKLADVPTEGAMRRIPVAAERVRTAPGKGVATGEVEGILVDWSSGMNAYGNSTFTESAILLLRDGWASRRVDLPPSDLDLKASRELEPQRWGKWRRAGNGYEVRWQDDHGKAQDWVKHKGTLRGPWPSDARLAGGYSHASFQGSIALGGMYRSTTHYFKKDGSYEDSRFAQGGSGSMAANNGYSGGATSHTDKTGTSTVVSNSSTTDTGGPAPPGGHSSVVVTGNQKRNDGSDHRGTYKLEGYTLEIRLDSGRVDRYLTFKAGDGDIWIGSTTYSLPRK